MSIQFSCPGCSQPIEVDEEHGGLSATCPYCSNVVTVPVGSTLSPDAPIAARPAGDAKDAPSLHAGASETYEQRASRKFARYAMFCTLMSWGALLALVAFMTTQLLPEISANPTSQPSSEEMMAIIDKIMNDYPWVALLPLSVGVGALVGFALALTSLRYRQRGNVMGVLSAVLCGGLLFCWMGTLLLQVLGGA